MKTMFKTVALLLVFFAIAFSVSAQVFIAKAVLEDFYIDADISDELQKAGYRKISASELPDEISDPMKNLTDYIDDQLGDAAKRYYLNETTGALVLYGVEKGGDGYFSYAVNFFSGNANAVERIRELFEQNELQFDNENNGQYYYSDGNDAGGLVGLLDNGIVMFAYFEP